MKYLICASLILTGCSSHLITAEQCNNIDWRTRGIRDAWAGESVNHIDEYVNECGNNQISVDVKQWNSGYISALHQQCSSDKAIELAASQQKYTGPCLADPDFYKALTMSQSSATQNLELTRIEKKLKEIQIAKNSKNANKEDLNWEEYQLQQELLDIKGTLQIAEPASINGDLFKKK
jgi:hypothetical protein